jgi:hypothetical protein
MCGCNSTRRYSSERKITDSSHEVKRQNSAKRNPRKLFAY